MANMFDKGNNSVRPHTKPVQEEKTGNPHNPLDGLIEPKPRAKSYGFYLEDEVVVALEKLAKQNKTNKSKVLNTLLRKYLLGD